MDEIRNIGVELMSTEELALAVRSSAAKSVLHPMYTRREVLGNERAGYGEEIYATLSRELAVEFGRGFEATNLRRMVQFAEAFRTRELSLHCRAN